MPRPASPPNSGNISDFMLFWESSQNRVDDALATGDFDAAYNRALDSNTYSGVDANKREEVQRQTIARVISERIASRLDGVRNVSDCRPFFLKPAYFLQTLTPYVSAKLILAGGNSERMVFELLPPSGEQVDERGNIDRYNNIIKNFRYELSGQQAGSVALTISDVNPDIVEYVALTFATMMNAVPPLVEVEFGWSYKKPDITVDSVINQEDNRTASKVFFRRNIMFVVTEIEPNYSKEGIIDFTFKGIKDLNFPEPLQYFMPYDYLGRTPGVTLQMIHTLFVMCIAFHTFPTSALVATEKTVDTSLTVTTLKNIAEFFWYYKQIRDKDAIINAIVAIQKFMRTDLNEHFGIHTPLISDKLRRYLNTLEVADRAVTGTSSRTVRASERWLHRLTENSAFRNISSMLSMTVPSGGFATVGNLMGAQEGREHMFKLWQYYATGTKNEVTGSDVGIQIAQLFQVHEKLRDALKEVDNNPNGYAKLLREMVMELTPALNNAKMHPWDIMTFCRKAFAIQLKKIKDNVASDPTISPERQEEVAQTYHIDIQGFHNLQIGGYNYHGSNSENDGATPGEYYDYRVENYLVTAGTFTIAPNSSWGGLFASIAEKCKVWVNERTWRDVNAGSTPNSNAYHDETTGIHKLGNVGNMSLVDSMSGTDRVGTSGSYQRNFAGRFPTNMIAICTMMSPKEAQQNLETFKIIIEGRINFQQMQYNSMGSGDAKRSQLGQDINLAKTIATNIQTAIDKVKMMNSQVPVLVTMFDVVPGVDSVFDPLNGKQNILQAYSYRAGGLLAFTDEETNAPKYQYNPGFPNVWHINFPDVIEFRPKMDFRSQISNVLTIMRNDIPGLARRITNLTAEIARITANIQELQSAPGSSRPGAANAVTRLNESLISKRQNLQVLNRMRDNFMRYHGRLPFTNPSQIMFSNTILQTSQYGQVQQRRRVMQEFRRHAMIEAVNIPADMTVIGDPAFDMNCIGKCIFLKMNNPKGDMSYFTGIYYIENIVHEIANGQFHTTFTIRKDATAGNAELSSQLYTCVTESDNVIASSGLPL